MKSFELYKLVKNSINYKINGDTHILDRIKSRKITVEKVKKMVYLSIDKMEIQKTYAVIHGDDKLLILRINRTVYYVITCLIDDMQVKRNTLKIYV